MSAALVLQPMQIIKLNIATAKSCALTPTRAKLTKIGNDCLNMWL
jgi:hypothetical protein